MKHGSSNAPRRRSGKSASAGKSGSSNASRGSSTGGSSTGGGGSHAPRLSDVKVRDIMTRDVVTVSAEDAVDAAARCMAHYDCGAIPVVRGDGTLAGVITDRDIAIRVVALGIDPTECIVGECMTSETVAVSDERTIEECLEIMSRFQIRRLPVVNHLGQVTGIVSQADLARFAQVNAGAGSRRELAEMVAEVSEPAF
jgi:CBS domain-containing protein